MVWWTKQLLEVNAPSDTGPIGNKQGLGDKKSALLAAVRSVAISCIAVLWIGQARAQEWQILDLGTLGGEHAYASALNNLGQVVGASYTPDGVRHAFLTGPNGAGMRQLSISRFDASSAAGINDFGQVVGVIKQRNPWQPFITGPNGSGLRLLPTLGGTWGEVTGINNAGQVVGYWESPSSSSIRGFITGPNGGAIVELGTLGGTSSFAHAINNSGQVTGFTYDSSFNQRVFLTGPNGAGMTDLGSLGGPHSMGFGVNDAGQVVGRSYLANYGGTHAFLTGPEGRGMKDLGAPPLPGSFGSYSEGYAVNHAGQVVGYDYYGDIPEGAVRAFVTGPNGSDKVDLNTLVDLPGSDWLGIARDINDRGQVIAVSNLGRSYLLTPVPEPSSLFFMLAGLLVLSRLRRDGAKVVGRVPTGEAGREAPHLWHRDC